MQEHNHNLQKLLEASASKYKIASELYTDYPVKRGLRNPDGTGVLAGLTSIGEVRGYIIDDGEKLPVAGRLRYRGISVKDIIKNAEAEKRFAFEETAFLVIFGFLPTKEQLDMFKSILGEKRTLPANFTEDTILKSPSPNIMNKLARSVLALYIYDKNPEDLSLSNMIEQSVNLISRMVTMVAYAYQAKCHYYDNKSLYIHSPKPEYSTAENFFHMIRPDSKFTAEEAEILDMLLVLQAEHGGGNNSAFTCRVVSSSGTDTYSAISSAIGSLKGPKHGGANQSVMQMMDYIKKGVSDWKDDDEVKDFLRKIVRKQEGDGSGLVYGMGHAVYTLSDPRTLLIKEKAGQMAKKTGFYDEFCLYDAVERIAPSVLEEEGKSHGKPICANVDLYSGFVYQMVNVPFELYTPLFAIARITGWCAHRIEEVCGNGRIMRPAFKSISHKEKYLPLDKR